MALDCLYGVWMEHLSKSVIQTSDAPRAIGTYSQGIRSENIVFTSGQIPINPKTDKMIIGDFKAEVHQVLTNLDGVLKGGGSSLQCAVKFTVFLIDLSYFAPSCLLAIENMDLQRLLEESSTKKRLVKSIELLEKNESVLKDLVANEFNFGDSIKN